MELRSVVEWLGGKITLKRDVRRFDQLQAIVHEGFAFNVVSSVSRHLEMPEKVLVSMISLSPRTGARRMAKRKKLRADESDRLMRIVRIADEAKSVLGSTEKARQWLKTPLTALGGVTPFSMIDTDLGAAEAQAVLSRIEDGVIS